MRRQLGGRRHPTRRDGVVAIALALLAWAVAPVLAFFRYHIDVATIVLPVSIGMPSLWLLWVTYRGRPGNPTSGLSLAQVADQLAAAVRIHWEAEAGIDRLNVPYPLPVSWTAADTSLTDNWDSLLILATCGAGWPPPPPPGTWATGPDDLAGEGAEMVDVLARVPTGRLVVLGEPGAGKTTLMVRLVLDLLARRVDGGPVPILASVASWDPAAQDLQSWLATRLIVDHPAMVGAAPGLTNSTLATALLAGGLILLVLDGLDEIPKQVRGPAISRINDALRPGQRVVVTCRSKEYRDAVRLADGIETNLRAAAAVQLRLLDAEPVRRYLCDDAAGPVMKSRWAPVLAVLANPGAGSSMAGRCILHAKRATLARPAVLAWQPT
jgi:NACHT domain